MTALIFGCYVFYMVQKWVGFGVGVGLGAPMKSIHLYTIISIFTDACKPLHFDNRVENNKGWHCCLTETRSMLRVPAEPGCLSVWSLHVFSGCSGFPHKACRIGELDKGNWP